MSSGKVKPAMSDEKSESSGVQRLIDRLHDEGVTRGKEEADSLLAEARREAMEILDQAKQKSEAILSAARQEAEKTRQAGEEAVRLAGRDAILELNEALREDFFRKLHHLVESQLKDGDFLRQMILEITRSAVSQDDKKELNLEMLGDTSDDQYPGGSFESFARGLAAEAVRDGLTYSIADSESPGVRVQFVGDDLEVDLSSETLTALLVRHLSPKFREILEMR